MKPKLLVLLWFVLPFTVIAQTTSTELVQVHSLSQFDIDNLSSIAEGSLVYNASDDHIYVFDGSQWKKLVIESPRTKSVTNDYTLAASDDGKAILVDKPTAVTITVPSGFPIGFNVSVYQIGVGQITFVGSSTTLKNRLSRFKTAGQNAGVGIVCTSANVFHLTGDLRR